MLFRGLLQAGSLYPMAFFPRLPLVGFIALLLALPLRTSGAVVISEVLWPGSDKSTTDEWLEIAGTGSGSLTTQSIAGWTLTGMNSVGTEVLQHTFTQGTVIESGATLLIAHWPGDQSRLAVDPDVVLPGLSLANTKLLLWLRDERGVIRDEVDDGVGVPFAGSNASPPAWKASMERVHLGIAGNIQSNWKTASTFVNLDDGVALFGTPAARNFSGPSVDLFPPHEVTDVVAEVTDLDQLRSVSLHWAISDSLDLSKQTLTIAPPPVSGSGSITFAATATGYLVPTLDRTVGYTLTLRSIDKNQNTSSGVIILIEPYLEPNNSSSSLAPRSSSGSEVGSSSSDSSESQSSDSSSSFAPSGSSDSSASSSISSQQSSAPCVPVGSDGAAWNPTIHIQSGSPEGEGSVSVNLQTILPEGSRLPLSCRYDFGDGNSSTSCNPPSHAFGTVGDYVVTMEAVSYCSTTVKHTLTVRVLQKPNSSGTQAVSTSVSTTAVPSGPVLTSSPQVSPAALRVTLSAALPNPAGKDAGQEWVELKGDGSEAAELTGLFLRAGSRSFALDGLTVKAGGVLRLSDSQTRLTLTNSSGSVHLRTSDGKILSSLQWKNARDNVIYGAVSAVANRVIVDLLEVIDGDTIDVHFHAAGDNPLGSQTARVRFIGVDAPEIHHANPFEVAMGNISKSYVLALLENKKIELEFDTEKSDSYGRLLAYVYADGVPVQEKMLSDGMASVLTSFEYRRKAQYLDLQEQAMKNQKGHWATKEGKEVILAMAEEPEVSTGSVIDLAESPNMGGLRINEIYPSPLPGDDEWIEVWNSSDHPIDLHQLVIDDVRPGGSKPWTYSGSLLDAGDILAIPLTKSKIQLNNGGDSVTLLDPQGQVLDEVIYPSIKSGYSFALSDDGAFWCITTTPTLNEHNKCTEIVSTKKAVSKSTAKKKVVKKTSAKPIVKYAVVKAGTGSDAYDDGMDFELAGSVTGSRGLSHAFAINVPEFLLFALILSGGSAYLGALVAVRKMAKNIPV